MGRWVRLGPYDKGARGMKLHWAATAYKTVCGETFSTNFEPDDPSGATQLKCDTCVRKTAELNAGGVDPKPQPRRPVDNENTRARMRSREGTRLTEAEAEAQREARGVSIPTVSGGLPTLGQRR